MIRIKDKVSVVTGGSRGIGRAIVLQLAQQGSHVAFNYLNSEREAHALVEEVKRYGVRCMSNCVDIKDFTKVKTWIEEVKKELGRIDILINNAGIINDKALVMMTEDDWREVIDTNLTGMFNAARSCIFTFMKQKSGDIINISSVSGITGLPRQTNYSASKGGMNAFTRALAKEIADYGIRVNSVAPGYIETEILSGIKKEQRNNIVERIPMNRIGTVDDVANCVSFLLSEQAQYITGQSITVDGGLTIR